MKKAIRSAMLAAAVAAVVGFSTPSAAQAQVRFEGRFRLPHGDIAVGVGDPHYGSPYGYHRYPVGSYVPYGYRVTRQPRLGYGFYSPAFVCRAHGVRHTHWVPVRRYRTRWVVVERPVVVAERPYYRDRNYGPRYSDDPYYNFNREYWDRSYHNPYSRHVHTDDCRH